MIGKIIPIPRHAAPCQGPLNRSRRKRNDLPRRRERKRQPAPAATNNTLRMSSDAGPILRNAERRYARSPALFPSNGMQQRHNRMMPLQAPSFPRCGRTGAFFISGIFKRRRHTLLISSRNQGYSVFTEECIFSSSVKESFSSLSIYGRLGIQILHTITIHG